MCVGEDKTTEACEEVALSLWTITEHLRPSRAELSLWRETENQRWSTNEAEGCHDEENYRKSLGNSNSLKSLTKPENKWSDLCKSSNWCKIIVKSYRLKRLETPKRSTIKNEARVALAWGVTYNPFCTGEKYFSLSISYLQEDKTN